MQTSQVRIRTHVQAPDTNTEAACEPERRERPRISPRTGAAASAVQRKGA